MVFIKTFCGWTVIFFSKKNECLHAIWNMNQFVTDVNHITVQEWTATQLTRVKFNHKCHVCKVQNELSVITGLKSYHLYDDGDQKLTSWFI